MLEYMQVDDLKSAILWYIDYISNGEQTFDLDINIDDILRHKTYPPHLEFLYSSTGLSIPKLISSSNFNENCFLKSPSSNYPYYRFQNIPLETRVQIIETPKPIDKHSNLIKTLSKGGFSLDSILDIEFFESFTNHHQYVSALYDSRNPYVNGDSLEKIRRAIFDFEIDDFESAFGSYDPTDLSKLLSDSGANVKVKDSDFSTFLDTEKIHLQFAFISKGNVKSVPILAYFGFGNYYPFSKRLKDKNTRFQRFSQINDTDNISIDYYVSEFKKSDFVKKKELKDKIDQCQLDYGSYFVSNFALEDREREFKDKYPSSNLIYPRDINELLMLKPIFRNKFNSFVAYNYEFY